MTLTPLRGRGLVAHVPIRRTQPKYFERAESMVFGGRDRLAGAVENPPDRRHEGGAERILDQGRRDEGRNADQPRLFDAEFHTERKPSKSGSENENVSERHRDEQPEHRSVPAALAEP